MFIQFEWAWQNPQKSKRLSHLPKKSSKEPKFTYKLRILSEMLNTGPWHRLPLTIRWLKQEYTQQFPITKPPPMHMPIAYGPIITVKKNTTKENDEVMNEKVPAIEEKEVSDSQAVCGICKDSNGDIKVVHNFFFFCNV